MTQVLIVGSEGRIGRVLRGAFPQAVRLDIAGGPSATDPGPAVKADVTTLPKLPGCDAIILLAHAGPDTDTSLRIAEMVVLHAIKRAVPVVFASSVWAEEEPDSDYGRSKLEIEALVEACGGEAIRLGVVGRLPEADGREAEINEAHRMSDEEVRTLFQRAVGRVVASGAAGQLSEEVRASAVARLDERLGN